MKRSVLLLALVGCYNQALYDQRLEELTVEPCQVRAFFEDRDGDGFGASVTLACEAPIDHVEQGGDCDDLQASVNPGADELGCNGVDDDCDSATPDAVDGDQDGFDSCDDCNDQDPGVRPGAVERCNGRDDDCDGEIDTRVEDGQAWFFDGDGDGYGSEVVVACAAPPDHVETPGDCDDLDPHVHPGAVEDCAPVDRNCDGNPITGTPIADRPLWFPDLDGDGFGTGLGVPSCGALPNHVQQPGDCDDTAPGITVERAWFVDADRDGYGTDGVFACTGPVGRILQGGDCNDADSAAHPNAPEIPADGADSDCDGLDACWVDLDGDGYGGSLELAAPGCTGVGGDCNDAVATINPAQPEVAGDGVDANCDGADVCFADLDGDGWGAGNPVACGPNTGPRGDCNDAVATIRPWAIDVAGDGIDQNCDGVDRCWVDTDGDGFGLGTAVPAVADCTASAVWATRGGDCAPGNGDRYPGAPEIVGDGQDQDCDGVESCYPDLDQDGVGAAPAIPVQGLTCGGDTTTIAGDCDDLDPARTPGALELPGDGIDQNCDGLDLCYLDADGDGFGRLPIPALVCVGDLTAEDDDCNDARADVYPGATELPADGVDSDCNSFEWCFTDADSDGFGSSTLVASANLVCTDPGEARTDDDCDDLDPAVFPGLTILRMVPGDYATIGEAVEASCDSDVIFVERGVYAEDLDLGSKALELVGEGPSFTVINGRVRLEAGVVSDLAVQGGIGELGGCVLAAGAVELRNVQLEACTGTVGGGAWLASGSRWIGGRALGSTATTGGGVWIEGGGSLFDVSFEANEAAVGAAVAGSGTVTLERVSVLGNLGGPAVDLEEGILDGVLVAGNQGAGIVAEELDAGHLTVAGNGGDGIVIAEASRATQWVLAYNAGVGLAWSGQELEQPVSDTLIFGNLGGPSSGLLELVGVNGVEATAPDFVLFPTTLPLPDWDLHLRPGSPGRNVGPGLDADGSAADRGAYGGSVPLNPGYYVDSDTDGLDDGYEQICGLQVGVDDAALDPDGDDLTNLEELTLGTRADRADTDGDGVNDDVEVLLGTDPRSAP